MYLFFDTEFTDFEHMELISIGIISEDKKHVFYKEVYDYPKNRCSEFVKDIVIPLLSGCDYAASYTQLANLLASWIEELPSENIIFVADYDGDREILSKLLNLIPDLNKKVNIQMIQQSFVLTAVERGTYNTNNINLAFSHCQISIEDELSSIPELQHHALYDALCNLNGWISGHNLLK